MRSNEDEKRKAAIEAHYLRGRALFGKGFYPPAPAAEGESGGTGADPVQPPANGHPVIVGAAPARGRCMCGVIVEAGNTFVSVHGRSMCVACAFVAVNA